MAAISEILSKIVGINSEESVKSAFPSAEKYPEAPKLARSETFANKIIILCNNYMNKRKSHPLNILLLTQSNKLIYYVAFQNSLF